MPPFKNTIPGVTGNRAPGGRARTLRGGSGFKTKVPRQNTSAEFREYHRQPVRDTKGRFIGGWGFAWQGLEDCDQGIVDLTERAFANLERGALALAEEMVNYAKENRPWTDRTEKARLGLQAQVFWQDREHFTIFLGHGPDVEYGIWLEVRWGGRYAILVPTLEYFRQQGIGNRLIAQT